MVPPSQESRGLQPVGPHSGETPGERKGEGEEEAIGAYLVVGAVVLPPLVPLELVTWPEYNHGSVLLLPCLSPVFTRQGPRRFD